MYLVQAPPVFVGVVFTMFLAPVPAMPAQSVDRMHPPKSTVNGRWDVADHWEERGESDSWVQSS